MLFLETSCCRMFTKIFLSYCLCPPFWGHVSESVFYKTYVRRSRIFLGNTFLCLFCWGVCSLTIIYVACLGIVMTRLYVHGIKPYRALKKARYSLLLCRSGHVSLWTSPVSGGKGRTATLEQRKNLIKK